MTDPGTTLRLEELWRLHDRELFGGRLRRRPVNLRVGKPAMVRCYGTLDARRPGPPDLVIDEDILLGRRLPRDVPDRGLWRFVSDVVLHEQVHFAAHSTGRPWSTHVDHDGAFAALAEHCGRQLGLRACRTSDQWQAWPYSARPPGFYADPAPLDYYANLTASHHGGTA